jgi:hypothetical protein
MDWMNKALDAIIGTQMMISEHIDAFWSTLGGLLLTIADWWLCS